jgi:hypothetical protein
MSSGRCAQGAITGVPRRRSHVGCALWRTSRKDRDVKVGLGGGCTDPRGNWGGGLEDNGTYVGHDGPSVKFISSALGRGQHDRRHVPGYGSERASRPFPRMARRSATTPNSARLGVVLIRKASRAEARR